jgi:hypothetical protein
MTPHVRRRTGARRARVHVIRRLASPGRGPARMAPTLRCSMRGCLNDAIRVRAA